MSFEKRVKLTVNVWSEFSSYEALLAEIQELKENNCSLNLAIHQKNYQDPFLYQFLRKAQAESLEVRLWPLLNEDSGYWPNTLNAQEFSEFVKNLIHQCRHFEINPEWIIFDLEPPLKLLLLLESFIQKRQFFKAWSTLKSWQNQLHFSDGLQIIKTLVSELKQQGIKVQAVTLPILLDEQKISSSVLQRGLGIPFEGPNWDEVSFMVYRPFFWDFIPGIKEYIVKSYALDSLKYFPQNSSLALGPVGKLGMNKSPHFYDRPLELQKDILMASSVGLKSLSIFCLEGIKEQGKLQDFIQSPDLKNLVHWDLRSYLFRIIIQLGLRILTITFPKR